MVGTNASPAKAEISLKKPWLLLWSLAGGCLGALGVLGIARFFGAPNAHAVVIVKFPVVVASLLLLHAGPWIAGRVHRSSRVAAIVATAQPFIAGPIATCWLLAVHPPHEVRIDLIELVSRAFWLVYQTIWIAAGVFLVNVLPLAIGCWRRSWNVALAVAMLQPFALLILAVILLITMGLASPR